MEEDNGEEKKVWRGSLLKHFGEEVGDTLTVLEHEYEDMIVEFEQQVSSRKKITSRTCRVCLWSSSIASWTWQPLSKQDWNLHSQHFNLSRLLILERAKRFVARMRSRALSSASVAWCVTPRPSQNHQWQRCGDAEGSSQKHSNGRCCRANHLLLVTDKVTWLR